MTYLTRWIFAALLWLALSVAALAQEDLPDYDAWTPLAERAESVIDAGQASNSALEDLRAELADRREQFLAAQDVNAARIATAQSQLDALGAVPESGEEPEEIATRRSELQTQLSNLRAPVLRAEEAFTRADGLISEIDVLIRTRQTERLLDLGPSPLNPALWAPALGDLFASGNRLRSELAANWQSDVHRAEARANLPYIVLMIAVALLLVLRGPRWVIKAVEKLRSASRRGTGVWGFLISLGLILLPLIGLIALTEALSATGMIGVRGERLLAWLPGWAAALLVIRWLAGQTFNRKDDVATLPLDHARRNEARYYVNLLSLLIVARGVIGALTEFDNYSVGTAAVLDFPILILCSLMLFRLGQILSRAKLDAGEGESTLVETSMFRMRLARFMGRAVMVISVVGPILSAIGYARVGEAMVYPAIQTLALSAFVLVLQRFVSDLYQFLTGKNAAESESLIPVLAGALLLLAALPVLALIWGARLADLTELWARFQEGFTLGDTRISPTDFLTFAIVFAIGYTVTRLLQGGLRSSILPKTKIDIGGQNAILSGVGYVGVFLAAVVAISAAGLDLSSLAIVAGALSVGIGFGLQNIVSNFVSGIILLIERPISEGDWIEVGGNMGIVKDISVRSTRIETFDRTDVIVPNGDFVSGTVTNYTRGNLIGRVVVDVGVAYGSDTRQVEEILLRVAREHPMVLLNPEPSAYFSGFGADSLDFTIRAILRDVNYVVKVKSDMLHEIYERFTEEGIEIPFAQRDVWLRNPETLTGAAKPVPPSKPAANAPDDDGVDHRAHLQQEDLDPDLDGDAR
ncbi:DUF3772 domain-containing protein [Aestuariicoccus sp. MJ-SS9]|uniref:DUF3772 domain-containing protein n=1 Tax=Aestuariicoccus sp. MJ-SS9 TaxID=3079855 RepID=UPI0029127675|nr:DUF3772 domain-containing protein [Aestuariicoccus sp. MJ-SS9]MDU8913207.1 DUF3772 domain-containing protein [Aestuariicoccus sp. MJ-SS9]